MSRPNMDVTVYSNKKNANVVAKLFEGFEEKNLKDYENLWKPQLIAARKKALDLISQGKASSRVEDFHWDWRRKLKSTEGESLSYSHFVIECDEKTQAMMQLNLTLHRSKSDQSLEIVYVDYLSVAPWNRPGITSDPEYKLLGTVLLAQAIGESIDTGFGGRVGLHSLPEACGWYKRLGMISHGQDPMAHNLEYFEISEKNATELLDKLQN